MSNNVLETEEQKKDRLRRRKERDRLRENERPLKKRYKGCAQDCLKQQFHMLSCSKLFSSIFQFPL